MASTVREIERKYEAEPGAGPVDLARLARLAELPGVASVAERGVVALDATYYDTADQRLAADGVTLRRRTGGSDAGWHLKLPVRPKGVPRRDGSGDVVRDEVRAPLADEVPGELVALARSRTRDAPLLPLVELRTRRTVWHLLDAAGERLVEISADEVSARRAADGGEPVRWTEIEAELTAGRDAALLEAVERHLTDLGLRPARSASKLARALQETRPVEIRPAEAQPGDAQPAMAPPADAPRGAAAPDGSRPAREAGPRGERSGQGRPAKRGPAKGGLAKGGTGKGRPGQDRENKAGEGRRDKAGKGRQDEAGEGRRDKERCRKAGGALPGGGGPAAEPTAGDVVLEAVRRQIAAIVALDPAVRLEAHDAVHKMRVATRRLRSIFRSYRKVVDRAVTAPVADELKWLAGELGVDRDREVQAERLAAGLDAVPDTLLLGPVRARLAVWSHGAHASARQRLVDVLDGPRYLALLDALAAFRADPPLARDGTPLLLPAAAKPPRKVVRKAVLRDVDRLAARVDAALALPAGADRDTALHDARKAAKRARYAAEAAAPGLGEAARQLADRVQEVQQVLGDHQDSVVVRGTLRDIAVRAHAAGEPTFTWGLLYGREEAVAAARERELPAVWARVTDPHPRKLL